MDLTTRTRMLHLIQLVLDAHKAKATCFCEACGLARSIKEVLMRPGPAVDTRSDARMARSLGFDSVQEYQEWKRRLGP